MNYLGHVAVALSCGRHDPPFLLGAALPDLTAMVGVRVDRGALPGAVAEGVACHLAADTSFHGHPAFRAGASDLRRDLAAAGLGTGPRRAIGHAGWELLLDGTLVGSPVEAAYREALAMADLATPAVATGDQARWTALLAGGPPPALRYDEPAWVADRLVGMLIRRPRLAVDHALAPVIADILGRHQSQVGAVAPSVLADVAASVGASVAGGLSG